MPDLGLFNVALFRKTLWDSAASVAIAFAGLVSFVILFMWAMLNMGELILDFLSKAPFFIREFIKVSLGFDVSGSVSFSVLFAVCFTHGVVLMLTWGVLIATTTRVTVAEIEKGTADMLLTLPINRSEIYVTTSIVWILIAVLLSFCPLLGIWIGALIFQPEESILYSSYVSTATNFLCLNLAIAAFSCMMGCILKRRTVAIGTIVGIAVMSSALTFLEPLIPTIKAIRVLSLLNYFRPVDVVQMTGWPVSSMTVLLSIAISCWLVGLLVFCRKDIPTA